MNKQRFSNPIKWHGGKSYLAKRILELMPPRCLHPNAPAPDDPGWLHYVEPYAGGMAVLLAQDPEGISEVANDMNLRLTNFWRVLQCEQRFAQFQRVLQAVPFSEVEFAQADHRGQAAVDQENAAEQAIVAVGDEVGAAVRFFIACRQSLAGRMLNFAPLSRNRTRRGMNEQAAAWLSAIEGLPAVHARLRRVVVLNRPALRVIDQQDGPRTLFYLDPPYLHETRATTGEYEHEATSMDHEQLLQKLATIRGRFLLSGYPSGLYDRWAQQCGWRRVDFKIDNKASSQRVKELKCESVWMNY